MKILVVGEGCKDIFHYGEVVRLSPEAPVPVFNPRYHIENYGMAGNVFRNIEAIIKKEQYELSVDLHSNSNWEQIKKIRYVEDKSNHMFIRVDENDDKITRIYRNSLNLKDYDCIVISDYNKGLLKEEDIQYILENHPLTIIDTKKKVGPWINNATLIKLNSQEYNNNKEYIDNNLFEKTIVTHGKYGCKYKNTIFTVGEVQVKDVAGAGDSFLAGLSVMYTLTNDIDKSIQFASDCSTIVVQKRGVCVI